MLTLLLFVLFGGLAIGCAISVVAQRNPLYSAVSLIGVFISLACLYVMLAAPFIAAVQVIVYAGAIMVLVVFVIMLLNVEEEVRRPVRLRHLIPVAVLLAAILVGETTFFLSLRGPANVAPPVGPNPEVGLTTSIGTGLFTEYLLPFEITSLLILMAIVGAMTLARKVAVTRPRTTREAAAAKGLTLIADTGTGGMIQPGKTEETGQAFAEEQIERNERASSDAAKKEGEE